LLEELNMSRAISQHGFTLVELIVAMVVFGIMVTIAVPSFTSLMDSIRVKRAADAISSFLVNAKSEAIKRNTSVSVEFQTSNSNATWCAGMALITDCDCTGADATKLCRLDGVDRVLTGSSADNVGFTFTPTRGTASAGSVQVQSDDGRQVRVVVSGTGRIRLCSPSGSGHVGGYAAC
jgi:type IV fimbrial biogenesis protein FimT